MERILCLILVLFSVISFADVNALNTMLQNFNNLKANFSEAIVDSQGNQSQSTGVLYIQKPNQFRWEAKTPNSQLFISNGQKVWNVEPDLEQVTITPLSQNLSTTPLLLLSGNTKDLAQVFKITEQDASHYLLVPTDKDSMIKQIVLGFDAQGIVNTLEITNTLGQVSTLTLSDVQINTTLSAGLFTYVPAAGMDVLQQ